MTRWFERLVHRYLGISGLTFALTPGSHGKIWLASAIPLLDLAVLGVNLYINIRFDTFGFGGLGDEMPEFWGRLALVTGTFETFLTTLAVAVLFLIGLANWERAQGSWMLLIGTAFVLAAAVFGAAAVITSAFGLEKSFDLRSFTWSGWAARFALLAFGYLFVAHRTLTRPTATAAVRRYRRRRPPGRAGAESTEP